MFKTRQAAARSGVVRSISVCCEGRSADGAAEVLGTPVKPRFLAAWKAAAHVVMLDKRQGAFLSSYLHLAL